MGGHLLPELRHFVPGEFRHPDLIDPDAAKYLDEVRHRYGLGLFVTDDARMPEDHPPGGSPSSLHYAGRAFDLRWINSATELSHFVECVFEVAREWGVHYELELALSPKHIHLGLQKPGVWSEILVAA